MKQGEAIQTSLGHLVFHPDKETEDCPTIVALHGRGTDEYDLLPLIESLDLKDALIIAPRAPLRFNPGGFMGGFAWYDTSEGWEPHPQTFQTSLKLLQRFLVEIKAGYPVNPKRLILLGFSQGTVMSYAIGLTDPDSFRGIAALSGYVPTKSALHFQLQKLGAFSIFISHGTYDEIIPVKLGREAASLLRRAGAGVDYREYLMGHQVIDKTIADLSVWMKKAIA